MTEDKTLDRRAFLRRAAQLGAVAVAAPALLSLTTACSKKEKAGGDDTFSCEDTTGLSEDEINTRESQNYVDASPFGAEKDCANCLFYTEAKAGEDCGGCTVIAGPIHPLGHCDLWAAA